MNTTINLDKLVTRTDYTNAINTIVEHFFKSLDKEINIVKEVLNELTSQQKAAKKLEESIDTYQFKEPSFSDLVNSPYLVSMKVIETGVYEFYIRADIKLPSGHFKSTLLNSIFESEFFSITYKI